MEENTDNNKIVDYNNEQDESEFKYDFVNTPWDDRTFKSKFWIVFLLISIFTVTMALVINNFHMHYKRFTSLRTYKNTGKSCYRLRLDELPYVARIQSATTYELLCLGAVVSPSSVLVNGVCVRVGQLRMYVGSTSDPRCRKGFSVDVSESIRHPGVISKKLVLLSSYDNIAECSKSIIIGNELDWESPVDIISRPSPHGRTLSRQRINLIDKSFQTLGNRNVNINFNYTLMVKEITRCSVHAGDLLLQRGKLFGIVAFQRNKSAFCANLDPVKRELKEIDADITIENKIY